MASTCPAATTTSRPGAFRRRFVTGGTMASLLTAACLGTAAEDLPAPGAAGQESVVRSGYAPSEATSPAGGGIFRQPGSVALKSPGRKPVLLTAARIE